MAPKPLAPLQELPTGIKALILDQWGVLHDGTAPYAGAVEAIRALAQQGIPLGILSNSGKRAAPNLSRIASMGFDPDCFACVMTSGEALWQEFETGALPYTRLYPITRGEGDAQIWAEGLDIILSDLDAAEAILLMGVPDGAGPGAYEATLSKAQARGLPVLCSNPDIQSPRAGGEVTQSPGALAQQYERAGGQVRYFGKPHPAVFAAVERQLSQSPDSLMLVGDSLAHDIKGAANAGWRSVFIKGGLHHRRFTGDPLADHAALIELATADGSPLPDYIMQTIG